MGFLPHKSGSVIPISCAERMDEDEKTASFDTPHPVFCVSFVLCTGRGFLLGKFNDQDQTVVEDPDWENPQNAPLAISMTKSSGPTKCSVIVYHKEDSASEWITAGSGTVVLGDSACSFAIPENHTFRVVAKATEGRSGYATLQVSLK